MLLINSYLAAKLLSFFVVKLLNSLLLSALNALNLNNLTTTYFVYSHIETPQEYLAC